MNGRHSVAGGMAALLIATPTLRAQSGQQDSTLNNLVHAAGYSTAALGTIGQTLRVGRGPVDVVLIPGWGFGANDFEPFMRANAERFRMVAVTIPGYGGTAAPPMPPAGTSYAAETWTRAAEEAVARLIKSDGLKKPIVLGHFVVGTQVAVHLAVDHPDLVGGVVIIGGEPVRYTPSRRDSSGKTPATRDERARGVDVYLAPRWFKTVTKQTFDAYNYASAQYSGDSARALALWRESADVPLPVMVRYLCEYMASDFSDEIDKLTLPTRVLIPSFTPAILDDPKQAYVKPFFIDSWNALQRNPRLTLRVVAGSRVFITDDHPEAVRDAITEVARAPG